MHRDGKPILRDFYLMNENSMLYNVDQSLILKSHDLFTEAGFDQLRGADLVFACIASIEDAYLVTKDQAFRKYLSTGLQIIDLNESVAIPNYRRLFGI